MNSQKGLLLLLALVAAGGLIAYFSSPPKLKEDDKPVDKPGKAATAQQPGFREAAADSGLTFRMNFLPGEQGEKFKINLYDHGCGVAVGDFDGDGFDDIYFVNQLGKNGLFRNKGDGTFEDVTDKAGVALGDRICVAAVFADFDNDGKQDLFVTSTRGGNVLFKNLGNGTFKDVTKQAGVELVAHCQTATFFDYDNDGYLDLFVTCTAQWTLPFDAKARYFPGLADFWEMSASPKEYNVLYHNNRDGTFTAVTDKAGLRGQGWGGDVAVFDYNDDGYMDLVVTNMFGLSQLYRNNKDGTFTDVTKEVLGRTSWGAIGAKTFDFNNDGRLDLFIVDMHSDMWLLADDPEGLELARANQHKKFPGVTGPDSAISELRNPKAAQERRFGDQFKIKYNEVLFGNSLFKNLGNGKFEEVSDKAGMETFWPWGIAVGDFDNDGHEDVFLPSGMGYPFFYWPSALMMNGGNETFTDRAAELGIEPPARGEYGDKIGSKPAARSSRCAAVSDFANDGRLSIVCNNFNDSCSYFKNEFPKQNYVEFRLTGKTCNPDAIGALVRVHTGKDVFTRQVQAAGGYLSQSSKTLHFGLGRRSAVDKVEITWPGSPARQQTLEKVEINKLHKIAEEAAR